MLVSLQESADKRIMSEAELVPAYFHRLLRLSSQRREFGAQRAPPGERGAGRPPSIRRTVASSTPAIAASRFRDQPRDIRA